MSFCSFLFLSSPLRCQSLIFWLLFVFLGNLQGLSNGRLLVLAGGWLSGGLVYALSLRRYLVHPAAYNFSSYPPQTCTCTQTFDAPYLCQSWHRSVWSASRPCSLAANLGMQIVQMQLSLLGVVSILYRRFGTCSNVCSAASGYLYHHTFIQLYISLLGCVQLNLILTSVN